MIDAIYSFGDSYTTTNSTFTATGTYAGGKNWLLKFKSEVEKLQSFQTLPTWAASDSGRSSSSSEGDNSPRNGNASPELNAALQREGLKSNGNGQTIQLFNYAESGDVLDTRLVKDGNERGGVMQDQWAKFLKHHEIDVDAKRRLFAAAGGKGSLRLPSHNYVDRRLFIVWIGINDICSEIDGDYEGYLDKLFDSYKYFLMHDLYSLAEAGNIILFNLPPLDRTPDERMYGLSTVSVASRLPTSHPAYQTEQEEAARKTGPTFSEQILEFNRRLEKMIEEVRNETVGMNLFSINTHTIFTNILDNPHRYGFLDSTNICSTHLKCSDSTQIVGGEGGGLLVDSHSQGTRCHVWIDGFHPTMEMQVVIGEEVFAAYLDRLRRI